MARGGEALRDGVRSGGPLHKPLLCPGKNQFTVRIVKERVFMLLKFLSLLFFISSVMGAVLHERMDPIKQCESGLANGKIIKKRVLKGFELGFQRGAIPESVAGKIMGEVAKSQSVIPWQRAFWYRSWCQYLPPEEKDASLMLVAKTYRGLIEQKKKIFESDVMIFKYLFQNTRNPEVRGELANCLLEMITYQTFKDRDSDREELVSAILELADMLTEADLVRCYTLVLPYASFPQKGAILKKTTKLYEGRVAADQPLSPDDLFYFDRALVNMHDAGLRGPLIDLMKRIKAKKGMISMKDESTWGMFFRRW